MPVFHRPVSIVSYKIHKILHHFVLYRTYTSSPSGRNQLLFSRDRELFLMIARTRRIAFFGSRIGYRSFLPSLVSHGEDERQKGKNSEYWRAKWARSLSISESSFFSSPVSSLARCNIYKKWSLIRADSYITSLKDPTYRVSFRVSLAPALEKEIGIAYRA